MRETPIGCFIAYCEKVHKSLGLCSMHYRRLQRNDTTEDATGCHGTVDERFERAEILLTEDGCWEWQEGRTGYDYGTLKATPGYGTFLAHRYALEKDLGITLGSEEFACHRCDNPPCINPDHLFVGDAKANAMDRSSKGRSGAMFGEANPNFGKFGKDHPAYGRVTSEETRRILSEQKMGELNPMFGKNASEGTRAKQSESLRGKSSRGPHTRFHTNAGVFKDSCRHCQDDLVSSQ